MNQKNSTYDNTLKLYENDLASNNFNGNKKRPGKTLSELGGLHIKNGGTSSKAVLANYFKAPSYLDSSYRANTPPTQQYTLFHTDFLKIFGIDTFVHTTSHGKVTAEQIPAYYDEKGVAYNYQNKVISNLFPEIGTKYDIKVSKIICEKGNIKNHIASVTKPKVEKSCNTECKDISKKTNMFVDQGLIDCGDGKNNSAKNPLGLINLHSDLNNYKNTRVKPSTSGYSFGQK